MLEITRAWLKLQGNVRSETIKSTRNPGRGCGDADDARSALPLRDHPWRILDRLARAARYPTSKPDPHGEPGPSRAEIGKDGTPRMGPRDQRRSLPRESSRERPDTFYRLRHHLPSIRPPGIADHHQIAANPRRRDSHRPGQLVRVNVARPSPRAVVEHLTMEAGTTDGAMRNCGPCILAAFNNHHPPPISSRESRSQSHGWKSRRSNVEPQRRDKRIFSDGRVSSARRFRGCPVR